MRNSVFRSVERERAKRGSRAGTASRLARTFGVAVIAAGLSVGCVSPPDGVEVVKGRELDDVPVKTGFRFVESETFAPPLAGGTKFRSWTGLYRGSGLTEEVGPWYVGAMKRHGWTFTGVVESSGPTYTYSFFKGDEEAIVRVYREYSHAAGKSINMVRAEVHPRTTESFLPDDLETLKKTGVTWTEPREGDTGEGNVQTISFAEETPEESQAATASSDFLLEEPDAATKTPEADAASSRPDPK